MGGNEVLLGNMTRFSPFWSPIKYYVMSFSRHSHVRDYESGEFPDDDHHSVGNTFVDVKRIFSSVGYNSIKWRFIFKPLRSIGHYKGVEGI